MKIGRGVAFKKTNGNYAVGCVKEIKDGALVAVEPDGTETELVKGTAHRIHSETLEAMLREATGVPLDIPSYHAYDEEPMDESDEGDNEFNEELDGEPDDLDSDEAPK